MKLDKFNKRDTRFAPWTALCLLSLIAAMVFALPSVVFAQTYELSQDCDFALIETEHTITATVTDGGVPVEGYVLMFQVQGSNPGFYPGKLTGPDGTFQFPYVGNNSGVDNIWLTSPLSAGILATISTEWTYNEEQLCDDSSPPPLEIGGWDKLKDRKWGGVTIAICGVGCTDSFNVYDVDLDSVRMAGVSPYRSIFRDSRLCEGGKDAYVDLVLRFKRREVLKALEEFLGGELVDGEPVTLEVTGSLKDGTVIAGTWDTVIKKIKKRRKWRW